jgi:RNA polymerase sigma-70 factor (TIGR02960 family)
MNGAFDTLVKRYRRELHIHCYRMLASFDEAEDAVQETLLRAWKARATAGDVLNERAWLYRIATNTCLDTIRRTNRRVATSGRSFAEVPWLQPYPDRLLDEVAPRDQEPDAVLVARETIELAFLATIQLLPARQRAVLILRDVLEWSAADTAAALEMSVTAVNSALQRARATIGAAPARERPRVEISSYEQELLAKFIDAHERGDHASSLAAAREDIRITMPPQPMLFEGREAMRELLAVAFGPPGNHEDGMGEWRLLATSANRMPTAASYLRRPGDNAYRAFKFDVLRIEDDAIAEATTFGPELFEAFGLPLTLAS